MKTTLISILLITAIYANAATESNTTAAKLGSESAQVKPEGLIPFLGVNGGYTGTDSSTPVEGGPVSLKLLGSYYLTTPYVFDLGVGIANQQFTNKRAVNTASTGTAFEAAARYAFEKRWQGGLVFNQFARQGSDYSASQGDAQFLGVQALKEFNLNNNTLARLGGRIQTLTNNTGDAVNMFMIDFQIGYDTKASRPSVAPVASTESTSSNNSPIVAAAPAASTSNLNNNEETLSAKAARELSNDGYAKFEVSKATLSKEDKTRLAKIAKVLKKNPKLVGKIEVVGRTDASGSLALNKKLSAKRAVAVKQYLKSQGLKIQVVAAGETASGTTVNAADRRADLIFKNVKDEAALKKALSSIE